MKLREIVTYPDQRLGTNLQDIFIGAPLIGPVHSYPDSSGIPVQDGNLIYQLQPKQEQTQSLQMGREYQRHFLCGRRKDTHGRWHSYASVNVDEETGLSLQQVTMLGAGGNGLQADFYSGNDPLKHLLQVAI